MAQTHEVERVRDRNYLNPNYFSLDIPQTGDAHPDCLPGEIFLSYGNSWTLDVGYAGYRTRRRGTRVYDDFGRDRTADAADGIFPIFVSRAEYDQTRDRLFSRNEIRH